jgi:sugar phosphate permease
MINQKDHNLFSASFVIFYFEFGGILGIILAGWVTDNLVKNRIVFLILAMFCFFIISLFFYSIPTGFRMVEYIIIFALGFFLFSQQMLIGLVASEFVNKSSACTANGLVGFFAYFGASLAGYPFSLMINISWNIYFIMIFFCEIILILIL